MKTSIAMAALAALAIINSGCEKRQQPVSAAVEEPQHSTPPAGPRRATAEELLNAAQTGQIPEWFSEAERAAVRRIAQ